MNKDFFNCILLSDFTINNLAGYLEKEHTFPKTKTIIPPFNQVKQILIDHKSDWWKENPDFAFIWTQPESVISSFNKFLNSEEVDIADILNEVDEFSDLLKNIKSLVKFTFITSWTYDIETKAWEMLDFRKNRGIPYMITQMNQRLIKNFEDDFNFIILDAQKWIVAGGQDAYHSQLWYLSKIPFNYAVFSEAAKTIKSCINAMAGKSKKIIILDLDDTLWGGIAGELGWENIKLGGHDPIGEAYSDFQRTLKAFKNRGILLAIVSKNDEHTALDTIDKHPEMLLRRNDFATWKINWNDKAQNIIELMKDLNIGLESAVFIDDNPTERARIREAIPEILVPEMPDDKMLFKKVLNNMHCFNTIYVSKEDSSRTQMYIEEEKRTSEKITFKSIDEWIKTINIKVSVEQLNKTNIERTIQLLNKTNQMNLSTRRMTEKELLDWAMIDNHFLWNFTVSDKFGNSGLTGIISTEINDEICKIIDFVLSCRIFGRKIEEAMLNFISKQAMSLKCKTLIAEYIPTEKNKPCLQFFENTGFTKNNNLFTWDLEQKYLIPNFIELIEKVDIQT